MKKAGNPFTKLDPGQLDKVLEARRCGPDFNRSGRLHTTFAMLLIRLRDIDTKPLKRTVREGRTLSVMRLLKDERFFSAAEIAQINHIYEKTLGEAVRPILDKDIRKLDAADDRVLRQHFGAHSLIPLHIFAASVAIDQSGVMEPTIEQMFRNLDPGARRAVAHAIKLLTQKPGLRKNFAQSVRRFARNAGVRFGD